MNEISRLQSDKKWQEVVHNWMAHPKEGRFWQHRLTAVSKIWPAVDRLTIGTTTGHQVAVCTVVRCIPQESPSPQCLVFSWDVRHSLPAKINETHQSSSLHVSNWQHKNGMTPPHLLASCRSNWPEPSQGEIYLSDPPSPQSQSVSTQSPWLLFAVGHHTPHNISPYFNAMDTGCLVN